METCVYKSPVGYLEIRREDGKIVSLGFLGDKGEERKGSDPLLLECQRQLDGYFAGTIKEFSLPLSPRTTEFGGKVLSRLIKVKYGQTVTYGQLARLAGSPKAARAAGNAVRSNPIPIIIPCHRVLPASGKLGNYSGGGPSVKKFLLELEGAFPKGQS